jgi:hypothetical protein
MSDKCSCSSNNFHAFSRQPPPPTPRAKDWLVFFSLIFFGTFQVKPKERNELCGRREDQTTYYVERKDLRCDPCKATLLVEFQFDGYEEDKQLWRFFLLSGEKETNIPKEEYADH